MKRAKKSKKPSINLGKTAKSQTGDYQIQILDGVLGSLAFAALESSVGSCNPGSGSGFGWVMSSTSRILAPPDCKTNELINSIGDQLERINSQLASIQTSLASGFEKLGLDIAELKKDTKEVQLVPYIERINTAWEFYQLILENLPEDLNFDESDPANANYLWIRIDKNSNKMPDVVELLFFYLDFFIEDSTWNTLNSLLLGPENDRSGGLYRADWDALRARSPFVGQTS